MSHAWSDETAPGPVAQDRGPRPTRFGVLRHRNFALFWIGLLISHTGTWVQVVGQGWLVYQLTNTPVWLGLTSLAFAVPMVVLPLIGGAVADRFHRIHLIRGIQLIMAAAAALLAALTYTGAIRAWHLLGFSFLGGVVLAFEGPARHASVPDLVDRSNLLSAVSLVTSSYQLGGFFGPALAGVLLGVLGNDRIYALFALNACTYLLYAAALSLIRGIPHHREPAASLLGSLGDGLRFVWSRPGLRALLTFITIAGVFGRSYIALMPVFARDVLHTDAQGLGYLTAAPGIGVIIAATALAATGASGHKGRMIMTSALIFALTLCAFALSRLLPLSLV
ncbi:MAG: MFS transporter, partial [bacterium]